MSGLPCTFPIAMAERSPTTGSDPVRVAMVSPVRARPTWRRARSGPGALPFVAPTGTRGHRPRTGRRGSHHLPDVLERIRQGRGTRLRRDRSSDRRPLQRLGRASRSVPVGSRARRARGARARFRRGPPSRAACAGHLVRPGASVPCANGGDLPPGRRQPLDAGAETSGRTSRPAPAGARCRVRGCARDRRALEWWDLRGSVQRRRRRALHFGCARAKCREGSR